MSELVVFGAIDNCKCNEVVYDVMSKFTILPAGKRAMDDPRYEDGFANLFGTMTMSGLQNSVCFMATIEDTVAMKATHSESVMDFTKKVSQYVNNYLNSFWIQFDNSFSVQTCYTIYQNKAYFSKALEIVSDCKGESTSNDIDKAAITIANNHHGVVCMWDEPQDWTFYTKEDETSLLATAINGIFTPKTAHLEHNYPRLSRAFLLLTQARRSSYIPIKITFCVITLECLFSTDDSSEVNHKVSERVAFFTGESKDERIAIFSKLKKVYDIRSKFVHGQNIKAGKKPMKTDDMGEYSLFLDDLLRRIFRKIVTDSNTASMFQGPDDSANEYFKNLVFS
jgi:hypothetical protein